MLGRISKLMIIIQCGVIILFVFHAATKMQSEVKLDKAKLKAIRDTETNLQLRLITHKHHSIYGRAKFGLAKGEIW